MEKIEKPTIIAYHQQIATFPRQAISTHEKCESSTKFHEKLLWSHKQKFRMPKHLMKYKN